MNIELFDHQAWLAILLTLRLALTTTTILLLLVTPMAWWLSQTPSWPRMTLSTVLTLPLVLPPSVIGFYLLISMGPNGWLGILSQSMGLGQLSFTFSGLVIGSVIYSLPFALQPIQNAFESLDPRNLEMAYTLKARPLDAFLNVIIPNIKPALWSAAILSFAHTIGEFGIVLMIGGNIPGQTQVVSTQIFNDVESMRYPQAHGLALLMVCFSFLTLLSLKFFGHRAQQVKP
jgi:molybdate transport system permease protein